MGRHVLILGADGFIGRHIAFAFREAGWTVTACARRTERLDRMGFRTLRADLTDPATHDPAFWRPHLAEVDHVVNAAGILTGPEAAMNAVHVLAPKAVYAALGSDRRALLLSAVGIDDSETAFARFRRAGEAVARAHGVAILRPGLVLGDTSYGGGSLVRAFAAMPWVLPVVGDGTQPFNPIHATDLAGLIRASLSSASQTPLADAGGPETVTQADMLRGYRAWLGLPPARLLRLPLPFARALGTLGDLLKLGPISRTAVDQLSAGVLSTPAPNQTPEPRAFRTFLNARPAGTQDLWHARLYLIRPALRLTLALLWLVSGLIGLFLPADQFLPLVQPSSLPDSLLVALARLGGVADLAIALALLRAWKLRLMGLIQFAMIFTYTVAFTLMSPALWGLPLGGLLKNLPLLLLVAIHGILEDER